MAVDGGNGNCRSGSSDGYTHFIIFLQPSLVHLYLRHRHIVLQCSQLCYDISGKRKGEKEKVGLDDDDTDDGDGDADDVGIYVWDNKILV